VQVHLFGRVSVQLDGRSVPVTGQKPTRVLRALAVRPRTPVRADELVEVAWSDGRPANPGKALQTVVMRLRQSVGEALVETVPDGYALGPEVVTDVETADALITQGLDVGIDAEARLECLARVRAVWVDDPLVGLEDWEPARAESTRLAERRARAEDAWLALRLELTGPGGIVAELEAAVAAEPLREQRWALLAQALRDSGRTADAIDALGRARLTLARELGIRPGAALQALEDDLFAVTAGPVDDPALRLQHHLEAAGLARAEGDARRTAKELAAAVELARETSRPITAQADLHLALGRAQQRAGEPAAAQAALVESATLARLASDHGRLAEAALAASGEAWQASLDAASAAIELLEEALAALTPAPSAIRARLLARYSVAASHLRTFDELADLVAQAEVIAHIVDDPPTTAAVLLARSIFDQDPLHIADRRAVLDQLFELAAQHAEPDWRAWGIPHLARITAQQGDVDAALALLDDLAGDPMISNEHLNNIAAGSSGLVRATVRGSFEDVLAAIDRGAQAMAPTMIDPNGPAILKWAQKTAIQLAYDELDGAPRVTMPFPLATMNAMATAYVAAVLAADGRTAEGRQVLAQVDPEGLCALPRDLYWLSLLWMLGRAVWELDAVDHAMALCELAAPVTDLVVVDGAFLFMGAVAHHAGLAAAVAGRRAEARELLSTGLATHERLRSPHWTRASRRALERLGD
jgi:DNA-binding SARP family transcriptional activator